MSSPLPPALTVDLFGVAVDVAEEPADDGAPPPAPPSPIEGLVWRPSVSFRRGVAWLAVRSWRATGRREQLQAFKLAKAQLDPRVIAAAADDIARAAPILFGRPAAVTAVTCGHSRRPDCFGWRLGNAVAERLAAPFVEAWAFRPMSGVSHPTRFRYLPPLERVGDLAQITGPVLVVDDLATSGFHMAEALNDARAQGAVAVGASWIYGTVVST